MLLFVSSRFGKVSFDSVLSRSIPLLPGALFGTRESGLVDEHTKDLSMEREMDETGNYRTRIHFFADLRIRVLGDPHTNFADSHS